MAGVQNVLILVVLLACLNVVSGFQHLGFRTTGAKVTSSVDQLRRRTQLFSYADQLRRAKEARSGGTSSSTGPNSASYQPPAPMPQSAPVPQQAQAQQQQPASEIPFSDDVYEHLNFAIGKLSSRMKSSQPMNADDVQNFMQSVNVIIADMRNNAVATQAPAAVAASAPPSPPSPPVFSGNVPAPPKIESSSTGLENIASQGEQDRTPITEANPDSPFAPLHGLKSTWQVENIDDMTTEEYYQEIYRRNREMKDRRMKEEGFTRESAQDYLNSLNKSNRSQ